MCTTFVLRVFVLLLLLLVSEGLVSYMYAVFVATLTITTNNWALQEYKQSFISLE